MTTQTSRMAENGNGTATINDKSEFEKLIDKPMRPPTEILAEQLGVPRAELFKALRAIVMPPEAKDADYLAFSQVAAKHRLNPFLKEIYPIFSKKTGKMQVVVPIDGWVTIVQREKNFDGMEFKEVADDDGVRPVVTFCTIYRKDKSHPTTIPERFAECFRENSEPWRTMPFRMLRHKAFIQCARVAFGIGGIADEEEAAVAAGYTSVEEAISANLRTGRANPFADSSDPGPIPEAPQVPQQGTAVAPDASKMDQEGGNAVADRTDGQPIAEAPFDIEAEAEAARIAREQAEEDPRSPDEKAKEWVAAQKELPLRKWVNDQDIVNIGLACKEAKVEGVTPAHPFKNIQRVAFVLKKAEFELATAN